VARLERKPAERVAAAGLVVQLVSAALALFFSKLSGSATAWVFAWSCLVGILVWFIVLIHLRQSRRADEEAEEWERLQAERAATGATGTLFEEDEIQAFAARNRLRILEKYIQPAISVLLALLLAHVVVVAFLLKTVAVSQVNPERSLVSVAFVSAITFLLFLIAMYASGMSRQAEWRPLRAGSSFMMLSTIFGAATAVALALGLFGFVKPDRVMAYVMLGVLGCVAAEILLNFILDFYRPRVEGVEPRPAYDSRLLGLIAQPSGILKTVAATLDYQFGFRVSQTWFYRFVEQALAPLILFQIVTIYGLTCLVIVGPEQEGILERFGEFRKVVQPGLCVKWPWPIERVYRFPTKQVKVLHLGHKGEFVAGQKVLWENKHYEQEYEVMVATRERGPTEREVPVNLIVAAMTVRYRIKDLRSWYYNCADPESLLEALCNREQIKYLAGVDFFDLMGMSRAQAADDLKRAMQRAADEAGLGVEIVGVGLEGIHPPVVRGGPMMLVEAFHELVNALEQKEVDILKAEAEAIRIEKKAETDAKVELLNARSDYIKRVEVAKAEAERFQIQNRAYRDATEIFKAREFLSAMEDGLKDARKYIINISGLDREHVRLNLEDPSRLEITDIGEFEKPIMPEEILKKQEGAGG